MARWTLIAVLLALVAVAGNAAVRPGSEANFSQVPGFAAFYARNPPASERASAAEQALLRRHRPRFYLPKDHAGLISFYDDYVAHGTLSAADGSVISRTVDRDLLNAHKQDPLVVFAHELDTGARDRPVVFARIDRETVDLGSAGKRGFTFLTYHAVFRHSGLAAGMSGWQTLLASTFGDLEDWHQLDHYTAVMLVLDQDDVPVAMVLQQHNNQRSHLLGETYDLPEDGRPEVDVAIRSNELYAHQTGRRHHKTVRYAGFEEMKYLLGISGPPMITADDITDPDREASYELRFLPPDDAFYTFQGYLGARRTLPGRSGPPGADYNTWPSLKPRGLQLLSGYWRPGNRGDAERLLRAAEAEDWQMQLIGEQAEIFAANLACIRAQKAGCTLR